VKERERGERISVMRDSNQTREAGMSGTPTSSMRPPRFSRMLTAADAVDAIATRTSRACLPRIGTPSTSTISSPGST